jgi:hypothetical protein
MASQKSDAIPDEIEAAVCSVCGAEVEPDEDGWVYNRHGEVMCDECLAEDMADWRFYLATHD